MALTNFAGAVAVITGGANGTGINVTTVYPAWVDTPMIHQEPDAMQTLNIQVMLTPDQVASEILQAVTEDRRDLTLAPNPHIALMLHLMDEDQDKAEKLAGEAFYHRTRQAIRTAGIMKE